MLSLGIKPGLGALRDYFPLIVGKVVGRFGFVVPGSIPGTCLSWQNHGDQTSRDQEYTFFK